MKLRKVISGGQTGVDRGGLDAAIEVGLEHGGWCPQDRLAEDGRVPHCYQLLETVEYDYRVRTVRNIEEADVTLVLYWGQATGGTLFTINEAFRLKKTCHRIDVMSPSQLQGIVRRLRQEEGTVLNVAGPRESKNPGAQMIAKKILVAAFRELLSGA